MMRRGGTMLGLLALVLPAAVGVAQARDSQPEPVLVELQMGRLARRTIQAYRVGTEALVSLSPLLQLAEVGYHITPEGRLEAVVNPGERRLVLDVRQDTMSFGTLRVPFERQYLLFRDAELYAGAERLGDLLGTAILVNWSELTVTVADPGVFPVGQRLKREAAREALSRRHAGARPDLLLGLERPHWDGLVVDYSFLAPSDAPLAGGAWSGAVGADALGGSLELAAASVGRAGAGVVRIDASWTGVWREQPWLTQLRVGDGAATGPRIRPLRGLLVTNSPFIRPSLVGDVRYLGRIEPGWSVEAYRGAELVAFDSTDAAGRFAVDLPVRYGENPLDFVAYGPFGEIREFNRTYRVITELLPAGRFEYGASAGACRDATCQATANVDLRYGASARWTVQAGLDQFWRDTLPDLSHPYGAVAGSPSNAWALKLEGVAGALGRGGVRYEPSVNLRLTTDYTRFTGDTVAPVLTAPGQRSQWITTGFWRPVPRAGFFFFEGEVQRATGALGTTTRTRLGASVQASEIRLLPYVRFEDGTRSFAGVNAFLLPRPEFGRVLGQVLVRTATEVEADGALRLASYGAFAARPLGRGLRLEIGATWARGGPGPSLSIVFTSYLPALRSYTSVTAPAGGTVTGSQYVQGSVLWDRATGRIAAAPGPSLERSGIAGRVFLDENANGVLDPGEHGLAGVRVLVGTNSATSDADGVFRVWDMVPFEPVTVMVDSLTLPSPLFVPAFASASIEPGPNRFRGLDIPVVQAVVLEGRVVRDVNGRTAGVGGVTLTLAERRTGARSSLITFSDGGFYAMGVKPGDYELTVDPAALEALAATAPPLRFTLTPRAAGVGASGLEIRLTPRP